MCSHLLIHMGKCANFLSFISFIVLILVGFTMDKCNSLSLGIDFGTSGVRSCLIRPNLSYKSKGDILHEGGILWDETLPGDDPDSWRKSLHLLFREIPANLRESIDSVCMSGTSSTALVYDSEKRKVSRRTRMYSFNILDETGYDTVETEGGEWKTKADSRDCRKEIPPRRNLLRMACCNFLEGSPF